MNGSHFKLPEFYHIFENSIKVFGAHQNHALNAKDEKWITFYQSFDHKADHTIRWRPIAVAGPELIDAQTQKTITHEVMAERIAKMYSTDCIAIPIVTNTVLLGYVYWIDSNAK